MKKTVKALSLVLSVILFFQIAVPALAVDKNPYTGLTYTHSSVFDGYEIRNGIDVSYHNGEIDFKKVKASGIDFVFVRVGYTGYTKSKHSLNYDKNYKKYINDAVQAGLDVGVYWYSQALNTYEAAAEADMLLSAVKDFNITLPVVFDYEFADTSAGRLDSAKLSKREMTDNALAFLDKVSASGYNGCLYSNPSFLSHFLYGEEIAQKYIVWLANYTTQTKYSGKYDFWQYSAAGKVPGISGNTDMNFMYVNSCISLGNKYYTGKEIMPIPEVSANGEALILNLDYTLTYENNINAGTAYVTAVGMGEYEGFVQKYKFNILPSRVKDPALTSRTVDSLSFSWSALTGIDKYKIKLVNNTTGKTVYKRVSGNKATVTGLTAANDYTVSIAGLATDSGGKELKGSYSTSITVHTLPAQMKAPTVKSRTSSSVTLTWEKVPGADGYRLYRYNSTTKKYEKAADVSSGTTKYTVKGLKPGTIYYFRVSAMIKDHETKYSTKSPALKTATKPDTVKLKAVSSPGTKRLRVSFTKLTDVTGYQIQRSTKSDFSGNCASVYLKASESATVNISTKQSARTYYVRIRAYKTVNGTKIYGAWSAVKAIKVR